MTHYLEFVVFCLVITTASLQAAFHLTRGLQDKFTNPQCDDNSSCSTDQCATYFARCETESCKVCVCDEHLPTYVASEKRCVTDDEIVPDTVPEYSSFPISHHRSGHLFMAASKISNKLDYQRYTAAPNQLWLYTTSQQLLNLEAFQCLDSQNRWDVGLRPCVHGSQNQTWYCNRSSDSLYQLYGKDVSYLDFSGFDFYMGNDEQQETWFPFKRGSRSVCDIPVKYKGCYRFKNGSSVTRISKASIPICNGKPNSECYKEMKISAPIFSAGDSSCRLVWPKSAFSVNDKSWTLFPPSVRHIHLKGNPGKSREITLQMEMGAQELWAGALLKLEIQCLERQHFFEQHCVLLKFDGEFNRGMIVEPHTIESRSKSRSNSYKASTIGLTVALAVVLLVLVVAAVLMYRRRRTPSFATTEVDDISARPFCDSEEPI